MQRRKDFDEKVKENDSIKKEIEYVGCDHRYFWNKHMYQAFKENSIDVLWCVPLICGHAASVDTQSLYLTNDEMKKLSSNDRVTQSKMLSSSD